MIALILQTALIIAASWLAWRKLRLAVVKLPINNLAGPRPVSWLKGNLEQIFNPKATQFHRDIFKTYGGAVKIFGLAGDEQVYFSDPLALHYIVVKEQDIFEETTMFTEWNKLAFGDGLLSSHGQVHKRQRKMLNPVFSANHLRDLTPTFYDIAHESHQALAAKLEGAPKIIDILDVMSRTALELIGQAGLGYSFHAFEEGELNLYAESVRNYIPTLAKWEVSLLFLPFLVKLGPASFRRFIVDNFPSKSLQQLKSIIDVMDSTSREILAKKREALAAGDEVMLKQVGHGKDIMSILLRENANASDRDRLPENEIIGQMSTLIFAAHDTTSSALARILHMLCQHPDAQDKLRQEVTEARMAHGDLSYDDIMALPYLDAVCRETLRLHAPVTIVGRTAQKATVVPLLRPVKSIDGRIIKEVPIAQGQGVMVCIDAANHDPDTWGHDADEWKPERWLAPLPECVSAARVPGIYSNMMTFLGGGRACIGFKFSQLEMKIVLSIFIESFSFSLPDEKIVWNYAPILTPSLQSKEQETPCLPLKVSLM